MRNVVLSVALGGLLALAPPALAQKKYDPGATDTEIKIGQSIPYSGPASSYGTIGKSMGAYFKMINAAGGIGGRQVKLISEDDGYQPPKTVEVIRRLVEQEEVLFTSGVLGTPTNTAIHKYMNAKKVPQLFVMTGATKFGDPKNFPWTMGWQPSYHTEGVIYGKYVAANMPNAKIAILYQNDDSGKDYAASFKEGLGDKVKQVVKELTYEVTDPTVDSQIIELKATGANVFFMTGIPKFAAQGIRKYRDVGWDAQMFLTSVGASVGAALKPAGLDKSTGIISAQYLKDATDKTWDNDPAMKEWKAFMAKWYPEGDLDDAGNVYGYLLGMTLHQVLKQCGDTLTRENVMKQAANLDMDLPLLLPGIKVKTGPNDYFPMEKMHLARFDGTTWVRFGEAIGSD